MRLKRKDHQTLGEARAKIRQNREDWVSDRDQRRGVGANIPLRSERALSNVNYISRPALRRVFIFYVT